MKHHQTYRAQEMQMIAEWILAGESGSVVGLPGCGRSNLLDFLCQKPESLQPYLGDQAKQVAFIPVDLNNLPATDLATLYRVILRAFYWTRNRFEAPMRDLIEQLYLETRATTDPFLAQSAVHELFFALAALPMQGVLVLNRFDYFCETATPSALNTLRGLRDSFKNTLSFIVGMRQEVAYLLDPDALGNMYELLDRRICWVGAMVESDANEVIQRAVHTAATPPTVAQLREMRTLSGNFPSLLKAVGDWWLTHSDQPTSEWRTHLTRQASVDHRLARLWEALTQEEQFALAAIRVWQEEVIQKPKNKSGLDKAWQNIKEEHGNTLPRLAAKGLIIQGERGWQIQGDLLIDYIRRVGPSSLGRIRIDEQTEEIYQGSTALRNLPPLEDKLLRHFIRHPYKRHPYSFLINEIFSADARDEEGEKFVERTRQDLFPLIRNLRKRIEADTTKPRYIINWTGNPEGGYQFYPEGRPE